MYLLVIMSSVNIMEIDHQNPKLLMNSKDICESNAWVQCQRTNSVDFLLLKKNINVAIKLTIGRGKPIIIAIKDIK